MGEMAIPTTKREGCTLSSTSALIHTLWRGEQATNKLCVHHIKDEPSPSHSSSACDSVGLALTARLHSNHSNDATTPLCPPLPTSSDRLSRRPSFSEYLGPRTDLG